MTTWATAGWYTRTTNGLSKMRWHVEHGEQTGRWTCRLIPEPGTWLNREHGEVGFYLAQVLSSHGCFNAYLRRFKKRDEEMCCYCDFPVDNAEHALFVWAQWGVAREALGQAVGAKITPDTMIFLMLQFDRIWTLHHSWSKFQRRIQWWPWFWPWSWPSCLFKVKFVFLNGNPLYLHLQSIERKILRSDTYPSHRSIVTIKIN